MKEKRKPIPSGLRYDVFERDKFTCQYCGRMAPDVTLEVDHIVPVSKGGKNELLNLVTSCRDCNRGKSNKILSENAAVKRQQNELEEMSERLEQAKMMIAWKEKMIETKSNLAESVNKLIFSKVGCNLNEYGKRRILNLITQFSFNEVYEATEIAIDEYFDYKSDGEQKLISFSRACEKIGGICYNRRKYREAEQDGDI